MWLVSFALLIAGCCATNLGGPGVTDSRCPRGCHCYDDDLNVVCVDAGLDAVPYILHTELKRLVVPGNNFTNLLDALYTYPLLEYLDLSRNRIVALDRRPFLPLNSLTHLDLSQNRLARLQDDSFVGLRSLQVLNLSHNHLDSISPLVVGSLVNLKEIYLGNNRLSNLFSGFFDALPGLTTLDLSRNLFGSVLGPPGEKTWRIVELNLEGNPLEALEANAFRGMRELKRLSLKECDLARIDDLAFNALTGLEYVDLSSNKLQKVPTDALKLIPRLLDLFLGGNEIDSITKGAFQGLTHLRSLDLSHSFKLEKLSPDSFLGLENLGVLNMSRCTGLYLVGKDALAHLSNLQHLSFHSSGVATIVESSFGQPGSGFAADLLTFDLSGCPLNCDCDAAWLRYRAFDSTNARCHSPKEAHGLPPSAVRDDDVFKCRSASSRSHWLVITIGVAGVFGSIGLFVVVFGIYCCCRRKRRKKEKKAYADGGNKLSGAGDTARDATPFLNQYHPPTEQIHYTVENDFIYFPGRPGTTGYKLEPVTDL